MHSHKYTVCSKSWSRMHSHEYSVYSKSRWPRRTLHASSPPSRTSPLCARNPEAECTVINTLCARNPETECTIISKYSVCLKSWGRMHSYKYYMSVRNLAGLGAHCPPVLFHPGLHLCVLEILRLNVQSLCAQNPEAECTVISTRVLEIVRKNAQSWVLCVLEILRQNA